MTDKTYYSFMQEYEGKWWRLITPDLLSKEVDTTSSKKVELLELGVAVYEDQEGNVVPVSPKDNFIRRFRGEDFPNKKAGAIGILVSDGTFYPCEYHGHSGLLDKYPEITKEVDFIRFTVVPHSGLDFESYAFVEGQVTPKMEEWVEKYKHILTDDQLFHIKRHISIEEYSRMTLDREV